MTKSHTNPRSQISLQDRLQVVKSTVPKSVLALVQMALFCVIAEACHKQTISQLPNGTRYRSVANARAQMPATCALTPLYVIDGVPQDDSIAAYSLSPDALEGVYLVQPSAPVKCPAIVLNRQRSK